MGRQVTDGSIQIQTFEEGGVKYQPEAKFEFMRQYVLNRTTASEVLDGEDAAIEAGRAWDYMVESAFGKEHKQA